MKKIAYIFLFLFSIASVAVAQKFIAQTSKTKVAVGETFQIQFSLNTNGSNFKMPSFSGFDVYSGPNQSNSMSFVNGSMTQSITFSYVLAAKAEGKYTISPAKVVVGGNQIESNSLQIEVVKGNNNSNASSPQNKTPQNNTTTPATSDNIADNLFIKASVSKTKAFLGEQISISYKVYTRYQLRGFQDIKFPDYNGFWSQDVPMNNQQIQVTNENIDGINYQVAELKKSFIYPQRSGKIEIPAMDAEVVVRKKSNRQPRDVFEQMEMIMNGGRFEDAVYSVKSKPVAIDVQELPLTNKPTDFSGAVGDFSYKAQLSKEKVKTNDAINLKITITGKGNIKLVEAPKINFPEDFEVYDPKIAENISVSASGASGTKVFDYLIIPRYAGNYKIEDVSFSYFNPDKKEYVTIPSPEFNIIVEQGEESKATVNTYSSNNKEEVQIVGNDIRYIKINKLELEDKENYFFGSLVFYLGYSFSFISFILLLVFRKKHIENNKDEVVVKSRKATKMAKKRLILAEKAMLANNKEIFYTEISQALYGYLSDKLNILIADLNKEHIEKNLVARGVSKETLDALLKMLNECEYVRYAPSAVSSDLKINYNTTVQLITKIEDEIS
ncbi:MAG: protein BatD [Bacteroidia bacterium]|nr:protein BatD [Bacteroidia bacterium]